MKYLEELSWGNIFRISSPKWLQICKNTYRNIWVQRSTRVYRTDTKNRTYPKIWQLQFFKFFIGVNFETLRCVMFIRLCLTISSGRPQKVVHSVPLRPTATTMSVPSFADWFEGPLVLCFVTDWYFSISSNRVLHEVKPRISKGTKISRWKHWNFR